MKQIITTIAVLCVMAGASAQGAFRTINFTYNQMKSDGKGGEYGNTSSQGAATGTIDINVKDSVVRIQTGKPGSYGAQLKTYKFTSIDPEQTSVYDDGTKVMSVKVYGNNAAGKPYTGRLARQIQKGSKPVMQFSITYDAQNVETFVCDYEKDLYQ